MITLSSFLQSVRHGGCSVRERLAQYLGIGPSPPHWLCVFISKSLPEETTLSGLTQSVIARYCGLVNMQKYAERWITIRKHVAAMKGWNYQQTLPDSYELATFEDMFCLASKAFDGKLYKPGKRTTWKDRGYTSSSPLGRHNFPNFNFTVHQIFALMGARKKLDLHFYWRLPKTKKVMDDLISRWKIICSRLDWPFLTREALQHECYALDPPAFFVRHDRFCNYMEGICFYMLSCVPLLLCVFVVSVRLLVLFPLSLSRL